MRARKRGGKPGSYGKHPNRTYLTPCTSLTQELIILELRKLGWSIYQIGAHKRVRVSSWTVKVVLQHYNQYEPLPSHRHAKGDESLLRKKIRAKVLRCGKVIPLPTPEGWKPPTLRHLYPPGSYYENRNRKKVADGTQE